MWHIYIIEQQALGFGDILACIKLVRSERVKLFVSNPMYVSLTVY